MDRKPKIFIKRTKPYTNFLGNIEIVLLFLWYLFVMFIFIAVLSYITAGNVLNTDYSTTAYMSDYHYETVPGLIVFASVMLAIGIIGWIILHIAFYKIRGHHLALYESIIDAPFTLMVGIFIVIILGMTIWSISNQAILWW